MDTSARGAHGRGIAALLALAATAMAIDAWRYAGYLIDDTFISLRYARNWVEGHGLVFNLGERVEGYTNFSFVALAALAMRLGIEPVWATRACSMVAALLTLALIGWIERQTQADAEVCPPGSWWDRAPLAVLLLLPLQAFTYWAVASFETMLFTALLTAAIACHMRERIAGRGHWSAVLFVALAVTRPEGALVFVIATAAFALLEGRRRAATWGRPDAVNATIFAVGFGTFTAWRWWYYGALLPNTFHAKVTGDAAQLATGLRQLGEWAAEYPLPAATLLLPFIWLSRRGRSALRGARFVMSIYAVVTAYLAYVVLVGGDFMPFYRFFVPVLPLQCVLLGWGLRAAASARARPALWSAAVLVNLVASHLGEQPYRAFVADRTAVVGARVGAWLGEDLATDAPIAVNTAGAVPYFSRLPAIDMLGLTDRAIAARPVYVVSTGWAGHRRGWGAYVIGRRPRIILWYNSAGLREPHYLGDRELADNPYFRFFYDARRHELPVRAGASTPLARFLGTPFGDAPNGRSRSGDLGIEATVHEQPLRYTVLTEAPIEVNYFELDRRDAALWPLAKAVGTDVDRFVDLVGDAWAALPAPPAADPGERATVDALCEQARQAVEAGELARARALLDDAVRRNTAVHTPLVFQYVANLAVLTGDLFTAVSAQKQALRLAPANALYRRNLARLLTTPYEEATRPRHQ